MVGTLVMAPKSVTFRRHDHLVSVLFGDLLSHSYNITFSMFLYLVKLSNVKCTENMLNCCTHLVRASLVPWWAEQFILATQSHTSSTAHTCLFSVEVVGELPMVVSVSDTDSSSGLIPFNDSDTVIPTMDSASPLTAGSKALEKSLKSASTDPSSTSG